jgi:hypothetical protein
MTSVNRQIIGAAFGEGGQDYVRVVVDDRDSYHYARAYRDGRVELEQRSFFSKASFYSDDPRRFLAILGGFNPETLELYVFIPFTGEWTISQAGVENLFKWEQEAKGRE